MCRSFGGHFPLEAISLKGRQTLKTDGQTMVKFKMTQPRFFPNLLIATIVPSCSSKQSVKPSRPTIAGPAPNSNSGKRPTQRVENPVDNDTSDPIPKSRPLATPGGIELDEQPVVVESLLQPAQRRQCYSSKECKLVSDNCGDVCKCVGAHKYEKRQACKDKPTCETDPCAGRFPYCTPPLEGKRVCGTIAYGLNSKDEGQAISRAYAP